MLGPGRDPRDLVAGLDFPFLQHTEVKAGSAVLDHECGHFRLVQANAQPVTGDTGLRHLEQGATDPVAISDTNLRIWQAIVHVALSIAFYVEPAHDARARNRRLPCVISNSCARQKWHIRQPLRDKYSALFDQLIGTGEQRGRHGEAKRLGGFEIESLSSLVTCCTGR